MLSFSGWNILGAFSMMLKNQGSSVILNMFYGPVANASFSIAQQVNNASSVFSQTVLKSFAPQITKNFASGNMNSAIEMTLQNSKISLIVIILIAIPLLVETPTVLILWLGNPPDGSITFVRLMLILALCNQLSYGVMNIIQTQGRIRKYMISVSFLLLIILPVSYVLYRFYFPVYTILIVTIIVEILVAIVRVKFANKLACFPVARYLKEIIFPCFCVAVISFIVCFFLAHILQGGVTRFLLICTFSCVCVLILSYKFIFNLSEKSFIRKKLLCMIKKK